jgi:hypothetical protein
VNRTSLIIRKAKKRKSFKPAWTKDQDAKYKEMVAQLEQLGFTVRREELKRGHCWKVVSGSCRSLTQRFIFVDSRLAPQEQLSFLEATVLDVKTEAELPISEAA